MTGLLRLGYRKDPYHREVAEPNYHALLRNMPPGGPQDRLSMMLGNILLLNMPFQKALEVSAKETLVYVEPNTKYCLTGAVRPYIPFGSVLRTTTGVRLVLKPPSRGNYTYICTAPSLDSGGDNVVSGKEIFSPTKSSPAVLFCLKGPEYQGTPKMGFLLKKQSPKGVLLVPEKPWIERPPQILSSPTNDGTVQWTPDGLIVLMRGRPTVGGYPRVLNLIPPAIDHLAQLQEGTTIYFRTVTEKEARRITRDYMLRLKEVCETLK